MSGLGSRGRTNREQIGIKERQIRNDMEVEFM